MNKKNSKKRNQILIASVLYIVCIIIENSVAIPCYIALAMYALPYLIVGYEVFVKVAKNLKNKTGTLLPIISIIINSTVLLWVLFLSFTPAIPQYLIYSKLGLIDTYFTVIMRFLESGGLLLVIGHVALIVGSFLSLPKKKKQNTINYKDTL